MLVSLFYLGFPSYTGEALGCVTFKGAWFSLGSNMAWCLVGLAWTSGPITLLISTNINVKKKIAKQFFTEDSIIILHLV